MYHILQVFLLISLTANPFYLAAASIDSSNIEKTEPSKNASEVPLPAPVDDHGFTFPLEDLVDTPDKHNDRFYIEFFNMLATLGLVIAIILIAAWLLRRLLNTRLEQINTTSTIKIVERRALSPKSSVYLLEIYDKIIVVAETQSGITQLVEFDIPPEPEISKKNPLSFEKILENKNKI